MPILLFYNLYSPLVCNSQNFPGGNSSSKQGQALAPQNTTKLLDTSSVRRET